MTVDGPMNGVRVLELGHYIAGPFCTQILADQGADVIKVEPPGGGARRHSDPKANPGGYFAMLNRNKRSIGVDLKSQRGKDIFAALVRTSDVLVTNFAAGVPERLGFGAEEMLAVNPRLVYVHATGFGEDSPYATKPAFDGIIQAMSGLMHLTGEPDGAPSLAGVFVPDHVTGLYAALAVLFGLRDRDRTDQGSVVDLAMLDSMMTFLGATLSEVADHGISPQRTGGRVRRSYAGTYATSDGYVYLAPMTSKMWAGLTDTIGAPQLAEYYPLATGVDSRMPHRDELDAVIEAWTSAHPSAAVVELMGTVGVPASPILSLAQILADPNVAHRKMVRRLPVHGGYDVTVVASPLPVDERTYQVPPPAAGEHTDELLAELGLLDDAKGRTA
jgi:crotonobetainyl-CoA:carnitine CoA-transferase CaiB-like acyl-CoA transferase